MPEVSEPYIREQLERRRGELQATISTVPSAEQTAPFVELLQEVDSAIQHIHDGTYGTCVVCQGTVEQERLIANPLAPRLPGLPFDRGEAGAGRRSRARVGGPARPVAEEAHAIW